MSEREADNVKKAEHLMNILEYYKESPTENVFNLMMEALETYSAEAVRLSGIAMMTEERFFSIASLVKNMHECCYNTDYPRPR